VAGYEMASVCPSAISEWRGKSGEAKGSVAVKACANVNEGEMRNETKRGEEESNRRNQTGVKES